MGQCKLNGVGVNTEGEYGLQILSYIYIIFYNKIQKRIITSYNCCMSSTTCDVFN